MTPEEKARKRAYRPDLGHWECGTCGDVFGPREFKCAHCLPIFYRPGYSVPALVPVEDLLS